MYRVLVSATAAAIIGIASTASAQVNPFAQSGVRFHDGDFAALRDAAYSLYRDTDPVNGASTNWNNPQSGSNGSVRIIDVTNSDNLCVKLRHNFTLGGQSDARQFTLERCLVGSQWQLTQ